VPHSQRGTYMTRIRMRSHMSLIFFAHIGSFSKPG
jgi:hypothetical protein